MEKSTSLDILKKDLFDCAEGAMLREQPCDEVIKEFLLFAACLTKINHPNPKDWGRFVIQSLYKIVKDIDANDEK